LVDGFTWKSTGAPLSNLGGFAWTTQGAAETGIEAIDQQENKKRATR